MAFREQRRHGDHRLDIEQPTKSLLFESSPEEMC